MENNILKSLEKHIKAYPHRLSRPENRRLFLGIAFLFHVWTIYQIFNDLEWIAARTQPVDALGYAGYSLAFALLESAVIFALAWLAGLLVSAVWQGNQLTAILTWSSWGIIFWAAVGQIFESLPNSAIPNLVGWFFATEHPLWFVYPTLAILLLLVIASVGGPLVAFVRQESAYQQFNNTLSRINVLTMLFIGLDFIGLVIVIIRNLRY